MAIALCFGHCPTAVLKSDALDPMLSSGRAPIFFFPLVFSLCAAIVVTIKIRQLMLRVVVGPLAAFDSHLRDLAAGSHQLCGLGAGPFISLGLRVLVCKIRELN